MDKRVYELASSLGITNNQMIDILWDNNINVDNYMSLVSSELENKIKHNVLPNYNFKSHKNKSSLKYIEIIGLFYKKNYKINFEDDINLYIAENGFGKTTILNIIVSTLKGDKKKLKTLPYKKIIIKINNEIIEISKEEFFDNRMEKKQFRKIMMELENYLPYEVYDNIHEEFVRNGELDTRYLLHLIKKYNYREYSDRYVLEKVRNILWRIEDINSISTTKLDNKLEKIRKSVKEEVLYLPTYRRIEEELDSFISATKEEKSRFKSCSINFGMHDVEKVINDLTDKLKEDAIHNYSIINGEILDDLLTNKICFTNGAKVTLNKDIIRIIIGRIGKDKIKQLDKLMDFVINDSDVENKTFLQYYLLKLSKIYENQKPIDDKIKKFRDVCNAYLVNKEIVYDEVLTEVGIKDKDTKEKIDYKDLSSGEKQILSLFCKIYLNTSKQVIFIIDEPELSLSIIWQRRLIEDIYESGRIALMISTTHSPYIFKNKYRTYAKEITIFEEKFEDGK